MSNNQGEMMDIEKVHAEFEAWAKTRNIELTLEVNHRGYYYPAAKAAWAAWQAALATAPSAAPVDAQTVREWLQGIKEDGYRTDNQRYAADVLLKIAPIAASGAPREAQEVSCAAQPDPDAMAETINNQALRIGRLESVLRAIFNELDEDDDQSPGHFHRVLGRWDESGEPCEWCATWNAARALLAAVPPLQISPSSDAGAVRPPLEWERKQAEHQYIIGAFDYERNPIGSREWTLYWAGWLARSTSTPGAARAEGGAA